MKKLLALSLAVAGSLPALAQEAAPRSVRFQTSLAFTAGGDTLASARYTDGSTSSVKAGGETHFKVGLDWQVTPRFSLQANVGYHMDSTKEAKNGDAKFTRVPFEGLGYWHPGDHVRLGLGLRKATQAKLSGSGFAAIGDYEFDASTAPVFEVEYLSSTGRYGRGGISLRYVHETYTLTRANGLDVSGAPSTDGSHLGVGFSWYF